MSKEDPSLLGSTQTIRLEFLGWERPILHAARDYLFQRYRRNRLWDLNETLIVLPGSLAGRRLQLLLAEKAYAEDVVLRPPEILTLGKLPEHLYQAKLPFATDLDQVMAWTQVLRSMPTTELQPLLFEVPNTQELAPWMDLGNLLGSLHRELASDLLDFADVAKRLAGTSEEPRWRVLATMQRRYLDVLHQAGLWDVQTARRFALEHNEVAGVRQDILLVGTVDLNRAQRKFLSAVASNVTSLIGAPATFAPGFDSDGTLRSEFWQQIEIPIPDESLHVRGTVREAADALAAEIAKLGNTRSCDDVTIGVPDPSLIPAFQEALGRAGVPLRYGPGIPISTTQPMRLLASIEAFLIDGEIQSFHDLIRNELMENWLRNHARLAASDPDNQEPTPLPKDFLASIDEFLNASLLRSVNIPEIPQHRRGRPEFVAVKDALDALFLPLRRGPFTLTEWTSIFRGLFQELYSGFPMNAETPDGHFVWRACAEINGALDQLERIPTNLNTEVALQDALAWLHQQLTNVQIPPPRDAAAIEMIGWLELALDDTPVLMLSGLHDAVIPESVNADAFLPNRLRSELGLIDNARRYARDAFAMLTLLNTRERVEFILNRLGAEGDPLTPSRLLLAVPSDQLARRVLTLIADDIEIDATVRTWVPRLGQSDIPIPLPAPNTSVRDMAVTDFKKYSECPYRFYLNRVLKLRSVSHLPLELDGGAFGDLVHKVLEDFFESPEADSSDPESIRGWLTNALRDESRRRFGISPPPAVVVQLEQATMRLSEFAPHHAEKMREGWRMVEAEFTVDRENAIPFAIDDERTIKLHGRIDRIDQHEGENRWAVWDYKTGDSSGNPRTIHLKSDRWTDWQLPLYGVLIEAKKGVKPEEVLFGYILLPKSTSETKFIAADFTAAEHTSAVASARTLACKIADGIFWPPAESSYRDWNYDDFWAITQQSVVRKWIPNGESILPKEPSDESETVPSASSTSRIHVGEPSHLFLDPVRIEAQPPEEWFRAEMIKASAGTGKTYRLASRAVRLLFSDQPLDSVLATTFTRKAAGEILQRILEWLARGCETDAGFGLLQRILAPIAITRDMVRYQLARLCGQLHRFRVSTLDSFYAQLARSFALELKLPPGWTLVDPIQEEQLHRDAVTRMFEQVAHSDLRSLISQLSKGEAVRSIRSQIDEVVTQGYSLYRRASDIALWTQFHIPSGPGDVAVEQALNFFRNTSLGTTTSDKSRDNCIQRFLDQDWEGFLKETLIRNCQSDVPMFSRRPVQPPVVAAVRALSAHAIAVFLASRRAQNEAAYELLKKFDASLRELKRKRRLVTFEDVAERLSHWMRDVTGAARTEPPSESLDTIAFRMDCSIDHLLLDEFQDTSPEQWQIVKPFAAAIIETMRESKRSSSFFCVGDSKQAIYAWRGGVSEIFESVGQELQSITMDRLQQSHRSSPIVIDFVNDVFTRLASHPKFLGEDTPSAGGKNTVVDSWVRQYFEIHSTAKEKLPGFVEIKNLGEDYRREGEEQGVSEPVLEEVADRVAELARHAPHVSIGILTRSNQEIAKLISRLRDRGVDASQEGGNALIDTAAVLVIRSALHLADHPGDSIAHFHVTQSPLISLWDEEVRNDPHQLSHAIRHMLDFSGLGQSVSRFAGHLAAFCNERDQQRLKQLIEEAYRFMSFRNTSLNDFLTFLDHHRVALPSESRIRVMTIHQSKGLEFDAVFLPSLDQNILGKSAEYVVMRASPTSPPIGIMRYMSRELQPYLEPTWQIAFKETSERQLGEAFCLFYVALTRARQALYLITPPQKNPVQKWGSVLQSLFGNTETSPQPGAVFFRNGDPEWYAASAPMSEHEPAPSNTTPRELRIALQTTREPREEDAWLTPSSAAQTTSLPSSSPWHREDSEGAVIGKLVHRWLEEIAPWIENGLPTKARLMAIASATLTHEELARIRMRDWVDRLDAYLKFPEVHQALSMHRYDAWHQPRLLRLEVSNERRLLQRVEDQWIRGTIDRCVLGYDGDRVVRAEILDFKTDQVPDPSNTTAWVESRVQTHAMQLQLYGRVLSQQYDLPPEAIQLTLVLLSAGKTIPIPTGGFSRKPDATP